MNSQPARHALRGALLTAPTSGVDARHLMAAYRDEVIAGTPAVAAAQRDCLALAVQFALSWDGSGTVHELHEGIREIVATMPAAEPEAPRCTCARSWGLHSQTCDLHVPGHDMANPEACQLHGFAPDDPRRGQLGMCVACRHPAGADCHPRTPAAGQ